MRDLQPPEGCLLTTARRGSKVILLHGETRIQAGGHIVTQGALENAQEVQRMFRGAEAHPKPSFPGYRKGTRTTSRQLALTAKRNLETTEDPAGFPKPVGPALQLAVTGRDRLPAPGTGARQSSSRG